MGPTTWLFALLALFGATLAPTPLSARESVCSSAQACASTFPLDTGGASVPIYQTHDLTPDPGIRRVVIVVHGNRRDADKYFEALLASAAVEPASADSLLLAPRFQTAKDHPAPGHAYWSSSGWKIGNRSRDATRISSFEVLDQILERVCPADPTIFPGVKSVSIVGHSAGGQFVQRYAAGGAGCANTAVEVRYVVMNPSSYLYLDDRRRPGGVGPFRKHRFGCWGYDDYKYGLRDLNAYMKAVGAERLRNHLFTRRIYYLAGEEDSRRDSSSLDKSCAGNLQGPQRLARHRNYRDYTRLFDNWQGSVFLEIPGVGHQGAKMLRSETARAILFRDSARSVDLGSQEVCEIPDMRMDPAVVERGVLGLPVE